MNKSKNNNLEINNLEILYNCQNIHNNFQMIKQIIRISKVVVFILQILSIIFFIKKYHLNNI